MVPSIPPNKDDFAALLQRVAACDQCAVHLPLGPRPVVRAARSARLMSIGQAPGTKVHQTGIPWNDASCNRLRDWLDLSAEIFYDETLVAIVPMGFCYPSVNPQGGGIILPAPNVPRCGIRRLSRA